MQLNNVKFYTGLSLMHFGDVACLYTCSYYQASQVFHIHTCMHTTCSRTHTDGFYSDPDYFRSHDHLGYIGADRNATIAATSMYIPPSMFNLPMPPLNTTTRYGVPLILSLPTNAHIYIGWITARGI